MLECELQLGTSDPDEGHGRGLLSSLIRSSTWGFLRKQRHNSSQGLSVWAEVPKPLHSSPFIYSLQWRLLSSDGCSLQCLTASTAGCLGWLTRRAAPARIDAKKRDVFWEIQRHCPVRDGLHGQKGLLRPSCVTSCIDHQLAPGWGTESLLRYYQTYRNHSNLMVSLGKNVCVCL